MNNLKIIENQGKRVLLTSQLAEGYQTEIKNIQMNYSNHKQRFVEGRHFHKLTGEELKEFLQVNNIGLQNPSKVRTLYLWTEKGALRHAKILDTDRAWDVYEKLEDTYFRVQNQLQGMSKELQAIFVLDERTVQIESRVQYLEDTMTIDYEQQEDIRSLHNKRVVITLGGMESGAYQDSNFRKKVFQAAWRDYKSYFKVNSYKNTARKNYDRAITFLEDWYPTGRLLREIEDHNNQMQIL